MLTYMIRRMGWSLLTIWLISLVCFFIIQAPPGDFVSVLMANMEAEGRRLNAQQVEVLRERYALDQPWYAQYWAWVSGILTQGDFGYSFRYNRPAVEVIAEHLPFTLLLAGGALLLTWVIAFAIGIYTAVKRYSSGDYFFTFLGFIGLSVPNFVLALVFMYIAFRYFGMSVGGLFSPDFVEADWSLARVGDLTKNLIVPALIIATAGTAGLIRITRANLSDELTQPYVVAARARGQRENVLLMRYPVRAAMNPFISTVGYAIPSVISGEVIVSSVLSLPTTGPVLLGALRNQDMYLAGSFLLILGVLTVIGTVISDLVLAWADPRVRRQHSGAAQ
ncbi:ABC transporter permease [Nesterenkonia haasae]|uniref:ABC transporter permease n=1 Tax=Nesterenkonia haasae TaxID=2587813 RepID=UPI00139139DE|nr:ABC transporter permease [Nesterenkonia haasae]NDK32884.1 ABC transporter permease [Nesterenkonia haasae]